MPQYLSPGVYVEEVPSAVQAIAGVGTSTAGFVGIIPDSITLHSPRSVTNVEIGTGDGTTFEFKLDKQYYPVVTDPKTFAIRVDGVQDKNVELINVDADKESKVKFTNKPAKDAVITGDFQTTTFKPVDAKKVKLCTNFGEFKKFFGDFSTDDDQRILAHAVYGFFNNGGTRCFVMRFKSVTELKKIDALEPFDAIDEIAIVAAPGISDSTVQTNIMDHCANTEDRFAILDSSEEVTGGFTKDKINPPGDNKNGAFYFPWVEVFDPVEESMFVGPSGHLAGIYARVDTERGVHKAPANEVVRGVLGLKYLISKSVQDGLNPGGINCIRELNGDIRVWGGRTIGGDANGEWKYINVRRLFLFLRESIDEGMQWVVFEPNDPSLWAKIKRNITAFLTVVWRSGALFGLTPQEAFYVKCDEETNPPELRELGQVVTEIGVAIVRPAEFVIFRISQWAGPGS